jgi:hypothetical protein
VGLRITKGDEERPKLENLQNHVKLKTGKAVPVKAIKVYSGYRSMAPILLNLGAT